MSAKSPPQPIHGTIIESTFILSTQIADANYRGISIASTRRGINLDRHHKHAGDTKGLFNRSQDSDSGVPKRRVGSSPTFGTLKIV